MRDIDFLAIGHVAKDITPDGWRIGGAVAHAAVQAQRLGLRTAVVTRAGPDVDVARELPAIEVRQVASDETTTFENHYENGRRTQHVWAQAGPIGAEHVPREWRQAHMVLVGPVLGEVPIGLGRLFSRSLLAFSPQGWLREVRPDGLVTRRPWKRSVSLKGCRVVVASEEDIEGDERALKSWTKDVPIVVITDGLRGARVHVEGGWRRIDAFARREVDPTGAGDVFAAAFVVCLAETGDVAQAARFASAAASLCVAGEGIAAIGGREEIERVLAAHPEVTLQ